MTEVEPDSLDYMHEGYLPQHNQFLQHAPPYISHHSSPQRIADKAEELRLRLRLLMYKIRTNQIHVPLGDLAIISHNASPSRPSVTNELRSFAQSAMLQSHDGTRSQIDVPSPIPYDGNMEINAAAQALSPYTSSPMSRKLTSWTYNSAQGTTRATKPFSQCCVQHCLFRKALGLYYQWFEEEKGISSLATTLVSSIPAWIFAIRSQIRFTMIVDDRQWRVLDDLQRTQHAHPCFHTRDRLIISKDWVVSRW